MLANPYIDAMAKHQDDLPDFPLMNTLTGPLRKKSAASDNPDFMSLYSGQSVAMNRAMPSADLLKVLIDEAQSVLSKKN